MTGKKDQAAVGPYRLTVVGAAGIIYAQLYTSRQQLPESAAVLPQKVREQAVEYIFSAYVPRRVSVSPQEGVEASLRRAYQLNAYHLEVTQEGKLPRQTFLAFLEEFTDQELIRLARRAGWVIEEPKKRSK